MHRLIVLALVVCSTALAGFAADAAPKPVPYPLQTCIVSGEHLHGGDMVVSVHKEDGKPDRVMHLCCRKCLAKFKADPAKYLEKLAAVTTPAGRKD